MIPGRLDVELRTNADETGEYLFENAGVAVDLTGYTFKLHLKETQSSTTTLLQLTTVGSASLEGIYPVEPQNGIIQIRIDKETVDGLIDTLAPSYSPSDRIGVYYDLLFILPGGDHEVWLYGLIFINRGITYG